MTERPSGERRIGVFPVRGLTLRARLTLWYGGLLALVLIIGAAAVYAFLAHQTRAITDDFLAETADAFANDLTLERATGTPDSTAVAVALREFRFRDVAVGVFDARDAQPIAVNATVARSAESMKAAALSRVVAHPGRPSKPLTGELELASLSDPNDGELRVGLLPVRVGDRPLVIGVAQPLHLRARILAEAREAMIIALPIAVLLVAGGGFILAHQGLGPVTAMRTQAERIEATSLHERLPVGASPHDELGRLAVVFNALLERLDRAFDQQRRFMADASHELRTPVAVMRGEAEHALSGARSADDLHDAMMVVREEGARMTRIVEDLFLLARADAADQPVVPTELYLDDLVAQCTRTVRTLATSKGITVDCEAQPDLQFRGDEALLGRLVLNLLDNAIKYTPAGGRVTVRVWQDGSRFRLSVSDSGSGVPAGSQARLFDRFYRDAEHRSDSGASGAGLGLAIVRWVARAHGGDARLARSGPDGSTFEVDLESLEVTGQAPRTDRV